MLTIDNKLSKTLEDLAPHKSCLGLDKPYTISNNLSTPKTVVATVSNWMQSTKDKLQENVTGVSDFMKNLFHYND